MGMMKSALQKSQFSQPVVVMDTTSVLAIDESLRGFTCEFYP